MEKIKNFSIIFSFLETNNTLNRWLKPFFTPIIKNIHNIVILGTTLIFLHIVKIVQVLSFTNILITLSIIVMICLFQIKLSYSLNGLNFIVQICMDYIVVSKIIKINDYYTIFECILFLITNSCIITEAFPNFLKNKKYIFMFYIFYYLYKIYVFGDYLNNIISIVTNVLSIEINVKTVKISKEIKDMLFGRILLMGCDFIKDSQKISDDIKSLVTTEKTWHELFVKLNKKHKMNGYFDGVLNETYNFIDNIYDTIYCIKINKNIIKVYILFVSYVCSYLMYLHLQNNIIITKILFLFWIDYIFKYSKNKLFMTNKIDNLSMEIINIKKNLKTKCSIGNNIAECVLLVKSYHDFTIKGIRTINKKGVETYYSTIEFIKNNKKTISIIGCLSVVTGIAYMYITRNNKKTKLN